MADKIFPTNFSELTTVQGTDKLLISGTSSSDTEYCQVQTLIDDMTGIDGIGTGFIPMKKADGTLESSSIAASDVVQTEDTGVVYRIPAYSSASAIALSDLTTKNLTSFSSSDSSGLYFMQNVVNGSNSLVGRVAFGNATRGLACGFYNNGTTQDLCIFPITAGVTSSTPQLLARQDWVTEQLTTKFETTLTCSTTDATSTEMLDASGDSFDDIFGTLSEPYIINVNAVRSGDDEGTLFNGAISVVVGTASAAQTDEQIETAVAMTLRSSENTGIWYDYANNTFKAKGAAGTNLTWKLVITKIVEA